VATLDSVNREPTPIQEAAYATADILLAGAGGPTRAPEVPSGKYFVRWNQIAVLKEVKPGKDWAKAGEVSDRLLVTPSGQRLVDDLIPLLKRAGAPAAKIQIHVMFKQDFPEQGHDDAAGYFLPEEEGEPGYDVFIEWQKDAGPNDFTQPPLDKIKQGKSFMADTLFHELLHVWFIHAHPGKGTGHGGGKTDPEFEKRELDFIKDLERLEKSR
jgi:hypothetical protein